MQVSTPGRLSLLFAGLLVVVASVAATASALGAGPWSVWLSSVLVGAPLGVVSVALYWRPTTRALEALKDGVHGFRSGDYGLRLAVDRGDEIGELVGIYNEVGATMQRERGQIRLRELFLETALETSPAAVILVNPVDRINFANRAARQLFTAGRRMEGARFTEVAATCAPAIEEALTRGSDSLTEVTIDGAAQTFHVTRRVFELNAQRHLLVMVRHMTQELRRQEMSAYRRVFRTIRHELDNSLAPIVSLVRSARLLRQRGASDARLDEVFDTIEECAQNLHRYVDGYARFARLPTPTLAPVALPALIEQLRRLQPFAIDGVVPARTVEVDAAQMQQAFLNLLKNAVEAGSPADEVELAVAEIDAGTIEVQVRDRGAGMEPEMMTRALLPFFSTKEGGTGLGLALCREILEAHGGSLALAARDGGGLVVTCRLPGGTPR